MSEFDVLAISPAEPDAPAKFAKSLRETGFAIIKDHDISDAEIEKMYDVWAGFFADDSRFDMAAKEGESDGYHGFKSENAKGSTHKDLKEFFHCYQNKPVPASTETETRAFHTKMLAIGEMLLSWLDQETPDDIKNQMSMPLTDMIKDSESNLLRILHYPPLPDDVEQGETRAAAHEDINLITLLVAGSEPGLQAQDVNGVWHDVPCKTGYLTINSGDMLAQASRNYYPSTPHRVINPPVKANRSRYSMPLFVHPRPEVVLDHQTAGEYLAERIAEIRQ